MSAELVASVEAAIARDDIRWHAGPMNMQAEVAEASLWRFGFDVAHALDRRFNKTKKSAMNQKDVPGMTAVKH